MFQAISKTNNNKFVNIRPESTEISTVVISYSVTEGNITLALKTMHYSGSSTHYTIDNNPNYFNIKTNATINRDGYQDQYVLENDVSFMAGTSCWKGVPAVNSYSINILMINDAKSNFTNAQTAKLVSLLNDINIRHNTTMDIVGLGEVNKYHIAPHFSLNWDELSSAGLLKAVHLPESLSKECILNKGDSGEKVAELQTNLKAYGYCVNTNGTYDEDTAHFVKVFSVKYLHEDLECASEATFEALNQLNGVSSFVQDEL